MHNLISYHLISLNQKELHLLLLLAILTTMWLVDICYLAEGTSYLSILFNDGNAGFVKSKLPFTIIGPSIIPIASGDFNKDGKADIALFNNSTTSLQKIIIFTSQGRTFTTSYINVQNLFISKKITIADFDKDGNLDLLCAADSNPFQFYKGNGAGSFQLKSFDNISGVADFEIADINKDGLNDIVSIGYDNNLNTFIGSANYQFTKKSYALSSQPRELEVNYFSNDAYPDIIVSEFLFKSVTYLVNDQTGNYTASTIPVSIGLTGKLASGDYDNDNNIDIVAVVDDLNDLILLRNTGNNSFTEQLIHNANTNISDIQFVDLNKDANLELVSSIQSKQINIYTKGSTNYILSQKIVLAIFPLYGEVADIDLDGYKDIVVNNFSAKSLSILYGDSEGTYERRKEFSFDFDLRLISLGDFNSDSYPDIAYTADHNNSQRETGIILSDGSGDFANTTVVTYNPSYVLACKDFNKDGKLDLLLDNMIFIGDGSGHFFNSTNYNPVITPITYTVGDYNLDGAPDLIIGDAANTLYIHYNNGNGTLNSGQLISSSIDNVALSSADMNKDGRIDVVVAGGKDKVRILLNQLGNTFAEKVIQTSGLSSIISVASDVNKDGRMDLIIVSTPFNIDVYLQSNSGDFEKSFTTTLDNVYGYVLISSDVNNDGKEDIVYLSLNGKPLTIIYNDTVLEPNQTTC